MCDETPSDRPAVRIICVDPSGRILLLQWHDPVSGRLFWEPPGGGVESTETPLDAARRELYEETGLPGEAVQDISVPVERNFHWLGRHYVKTEPFYLARFPDTPTVAPAAFTPEENDTYAGASWFPPSTIATLKALEPPNLLEAIAPLLPAETSRHHRSPHSRR